MLEIIIIVFCVYLIYYFVSVSRYDKNGHVKKLKGNIKKMSNNELIAQDYDALPNEAKYFIRKYNVDTKKINFKALLKLIGFVLGIDIAIVSLIVLNFIDNFVLQMVISCIAILPLFLLSMKIVAIEFKKRGLIKNV